MMKTYSPSLAAYLKEAEEALLQAEASTLIREVCVQTAEKALDRVDTILQELKQRGEIPPQDAPKDLNSSECLTTDSSPNNFIVPFLPEEERESPGDGNSGRSNLGSGLSGESSSDSRSPPCVLVPSKKKSLLSPTPRYPNEIRRYRSSRRLFTTPPPTCEQDQSFATPSRLATFNQDQSFVAPSRLAASTFDQDQSFVVPSRLAASTASQDHYPQFSSPWARSFQVREATSSPPSSFPSRSLDSAFPTPFLLDSNNLSQGAYFVQPTYPHLEPGVVVPSRRKRKREKRGGRFPCPYPGCNKTYTAKFSLKRHSKKHTGETFFACGQSGCGKSFPEKWRLKRHQGVRSREEEDQEVTSELRF